MDFLDFLGTFKRKVRVFLWLTILYIVFNVRVFHANFHVNSIFFPIDFQPAEKKKKSAIYLVSNGEPPLFWTQLL
jgi:hypothetical protein